jgi:hypothetical protein
VRTFVIESYSPTNQAHGKQKPANLRERRFLKLASRRVSGKSKQRDLLSGANLEEDKRDSLYVRKVSAAGFKSAGKERAG